MRFAIAGASGFLGTAWTDHLQKHGHEVTRLVRRPAGVGESQWDPYAELVDLDVIARADVVANLAGAPVAHFPLTKAYQQTLWDSRIATTTTLAKAIAYTDSKPAFLAQNGIAAYGDCGSAVITEDAPTNADTVLGRLAVAWAEATGPAANTGARVVVMRTAIPLHRSGGALKPMLLPFKLGLGGPIGSGEQYFSTLSLHDWLRAATFLAENKAASGAYNLTGPQPVTNKEYTRALAKALRRPAFLRVPAWPIRKLAGPLAPELLGSVRLEPRRLLDDGFTFDHPTVESQVQAALS